MQPMDPQHGICKIKLYLYAKIFRSVASFFFLEKHTIFGFFWNTKRGVAIVTISTY